MEGQILEGENEVEGEKEHGGKREKPVVRPEEIPPVPENRFLLRRDMPSQENKTEMSVGLYLYAVYRNICCHTRLSIYFEM